MSEHTPGPWQYYADMRPVELSGGRFHESDEYLSGWNVRSEKGEIVGIEGILSDGEANARLIAAAPDVVRELTDLVDWLHDNARFFEGEVDIRDVLFGPRAAIALATER